MRSAGQRTSADQRDTKQAPDYDVGLDAAAESTVGNRLSKIYTRTGDDGSTGLGNGERVEKRSQRVEAYGAVDETNSAIGAILAESVVDENLRVSLIRIQHELFEVGAELCRPGYQSIEPNHVRQLETDLDALNEHLPPLKDFVLPGGNRAAAACHMARTICRRAERDAWRLASNEPVNKPLLHYLNRLSDYLFVVARQLSQLDSGQEILWKRNS